MTITELIEEILNEWAYRVENGMPDPKNPIHLKELGIVLSEMGLSHIKNDLVENLLMEKGKTPVKHVVEADKKFSNPILSKKVSYKDKDGNAKDGIVGNLLRLPKDSPGRVAAEKLLPPEGSPERDSMNKDLGGEGQPKKPEDEKGKEGGEEGAPKEDPAKAAAVMFDPKSDPAMGARMDREKDANAALAKDAEADKAAEKEQEPKKEDEFIPIDSKDVAKEMPQADPETFNGDSDIPDGIEPEDLEKFNTDISKVQQIVADAKAKGEKAPDINLCDITVPGTNLYCDDNLGIPRDQMPQFKGKPQPGTPAADMKVDEKGEVDTEPLFKKMLEEKGIKVVQTEIPSDKLKATQKDLVGAKVVGMMGALEENPEHPSITAPIYVSRDGYVIDGHHRWAAIAAYNAKYPDKQIPMKVQVIDQDIKDAIPMCNKFAEEQGVAAKKADANKEAPTEQPNAAKEKTKEKTTKVANDLKGRTTSEGEELDVDTTENGSLIIGVEHGDNKESNKQAIEQIKKLPKDTKVMFVGEGGMSKDDDGNIEFGGEQDEIRNEVKGHFDNAEESSWDENADITSDTSPVFDEVANVLGGSKSKAKAAIWSNMYGQDGKDAEMDVDDYLDDEGKAWLIDQAKKGGVTSIDKDTDFNNLSDAQQKDLYELNYRDDDGYGETEISKGQESYNGFRQKELDRKIKEAEDNGYTVIAPVGNSHVDMRRQRNKKAGATSTPSTPTSTPKSPSTSTSSTSSTSSTTSNPSTTSTPTSAPKLTDKVKQKISNWTEKEKAFFERNEGAPGSKERRSLGQALKDKAAGALKAIKKGAKHEVEEFKAAGSGVKNFFSGKPLSKHEQKALKAVAFKVVTTAVFGAAFGGLSHGVAAFGKHVAMEFIPHIIGETLLKGVGKAAVFADAEGEAENDANVLKFTEMIAKGLEEMEITPEMMEQMVDSYNEKKENGEVDSDTTTTGVKAEHLHLVDELMLEMIYGFIEEAKGTPSTTTSDWKLAARIGGPKGKIVYFGSKEKKDVALNAGTHVDVDKNLKAKDSESTTKEPVAGAGLFDKDYKDRRDTEKAALNTKSDSGVQSLDSFLSGIADTANTKKQKETIKTSVQAMNDVFDKLVNNPKNPHAKSHKKVQTLMNNIFNGKKLTDEEKIFLQQFVRIAEPTAKKPDTAKYYIAVEPGDFKGNKRVKIAVGGKSGSTPTYAAFRQFTERGGLTQMSASTFGTKLTTANQTFVNEKGQTKTLNRKDGKPFASVQTNKKTGQVEAVTIGGTTISRLNENEKNITPEEKKFRQRNNRNIDEYSKAIEKGDLKFIDMDEGVSPDTPKNRVTVIQGALNGMAVRLRNLAKKEGVTDERVTKLIDEMQVFSQRDPNKNPEQWFKDLNGLMSSIANDEGEPSLKECWANYAEVYSAIVEMHDGGKGTQNGACALLPESTTLETVDIITINTNGVGERKIVTLNGKSVKKGVGGASALTSKTEKSTYKDDPTGSKKEAIIELSESHDDIYRMKLTEPMNEHVKLQKEYRNNLKDKAKSLGVSNQFISEIENNMKEPNSGWKSITAAENAILEQRKKAGLDVSTDTMKKIRMRLENYYMYGHLAHEAYNTNVDVQDFSNDSILSQPGDKGGSQLVKNKTIKIDSSNGVTILAYPRFEFNVGTWGMEGRSGNAGAGRFHNELKR